MPLFYLFFSLFISIGWLPDCAKKTEQMTDVSLVLCGGRNVPLFYLVSIYVLCCGIDQNH